jgi:2-amino-4-hydroxy-6-hydroxymethyldihydropteridine diphosphokinase
MNSVYLLTGGNIGNRMANLQSAIAAIESEVGVVNQTSSIYETAAWGLTDQPSFLNQVIHVQTTLEAAQLLEKILQIEKSLGRSRTEKMGPRTIDIDILLFNDAIINEPDLIIPHPHMTQRRFVLTPLGELAPTLIHPVWHASIEELLNACQDPLPVQLYTNSLI